MKYEVKTEGNGKDTLFIEENQRLNLVDRIFLLYHHEQIESLRHGTFLSDYPFRQGVIKHILVQEARLPTYIQESMQADPFTHRLHFCEARQNPKAQTSSWTDERLARARRLRKDFIMELLPLTLRVVYDGQQPNSHYWVLEKYGNNLEMIFQHLRGVLLLHVVLASRFRWDCSQTVKENANRFVGFIQKSLRPSGVFSLDKKDDLLLVDFSELVPLEGDSFDNQKGGEQVILYQRISPSKRGNGHEGATIELKDAIEKFRASLDSRAKNEFDSNLRQLGGEKTKRRIRRDSGVQIRFRNYLRESGFRPPIKDSPAKTPPTWQGTLTIERGGKKMDWFTKLPDVARAFQKRAYLLSPMEQKIIRSVLKQTAEGQRDGKNFSTLISEVAEDIGSTPLSVKTLFWRSKGVLLGQSTNEGRIIFKERIHRRRQFLAQLIQKSESDGQFPGFSETDSRVLRFYHLNSSMNLTEIAVALSLGEATVTRAIKKLDIYTARTG